MKIGVSECLLGVMKIGVSECLLGVQCRYDGLGAGNKYVRETLQSYFDFHAACPEKLIFGTPREAIRQVEKEGKVTIQTSNSEKDVTRPLEEICEQLASDNCNEELCGFIVKSKSPTCGLERVHVYDAIHPVHEKKGVGLFVQALKRHYPYLPIEEEGRLEDASLRENFLMQVFAYHDLKSFMQRKPKMRDLVAFHTSYKYLIYAKSPVAYKLMGNVVANRHNLPLEEILKNYETQFLLAIHEKGNIAKTYNVLLHIYGYFKKIISPEEKQHLLTSIEEFKDQIIPLVAVTKLLNLYVKRFEMEYLKTQKFLNPYPSALGLRSERKAFSA
jgi:uncharacterized protein YbgA (DUF1722 family)/uncharacterized protein YbbK (DUF523 family)